MTRPVTIKLGGVAGQHADSVRVVAESTPADTVAKWLNHLPALSLDPKQPGISSVVFGAVLIVVMLLVPTGIGGLLRRLLRPLTARLYTRA